MAAKKKRKRSLPASARSSPSRSVAPTRTRARASDVPWILSLVVVAALLAAVGVAYDDGLFAPFFLSRLLPVLPLAICLALLALVRVSPGVRSFRVDALDVAALAFAGWQSISAVLSPTFAVSFFGYYNRGTGAVFWLAVALILIAGRRLLGDERSLRPLAWIVAAVLALAGAVAVAQAFGATELWGGVAGLDRLTGTTGNPISLGGLGLLAVWLGAGLPRWRRGSATWVIAGVGTLAGLTAVVLSVSRAAMAAIVVCGVILIVVGLRRRRRAALVTAAIVTSLVVLIAVGYAAGPGTSLLTRFRGAPAGGLNSSDDKRVELWSEALQGAKAYPLAGAGSGAFVVADRLFRPAERRIANPWALASDPHSLPLVIAAGSGVIGLVIGGLAVWLLVARLWRRSHPGLNDGDAADDSPPQTDAEVAAAGSAATMALLYLVAVGVFSLVSPVEAVVLVPAAVLAGAAAGAPAAGQRWSWRLGAMRSPRAGRAVFVVLLAVCAAGLVVSVIAGVQWYRADRSFAAFTRGGSADAGEKAADLWRWEPFYALQAGAHVWREGLAADDQPTIDRGRRLVERGVALDKTGALGPADLARLELSRGEAASAVARLRDGLDWNPSQPVLQGLWGYSALASQTSLEKPAVARQLLAGLEDLPVDTPDGWFWISRTLAARGDASGARQARARAEDLAPHLGSWRYRQRLLQSR